MLTRVSCLLLSATALFSGEFRSGQAARAVIGQSSFSVQAGSLHPAGLAISEGKLFVADESRRVFSYDLGSISDLITGDSSGCGLCIPVPSAVISQSVLPQASRVSIFGSSVAVADPANHRVLFWRNSRSLKALLGPDVILGGVAGTVDASTLVNPISVALDGQRLYIGDAALHRVLLWNSLPSSNDQPADVVLGQSDFGTSDPKIAEPARITSPTALLSDGRNLFVADSIDRRVLVFTPGDFPLTDDALVNTATRKAGPLAPGALFTLYAENLATQSESAPDDGQHELPPSLSGVSLVLNGRRLKLLSVSPDEVRGQIPYEVNQGDAASLYAQLVSDDGHVSISTPITVAFRASSPGILAFPGAEPRSGMVLHARDDGNQAVNPVTVSQPAHAGEKLLIWASGLGMTLDTEYGVRPVAGRPYPGRVGPVQLPVRAEVNGTPVEVVSATLPLGSIGIYEIWVRLPRDLAPDTKAKLAIFQGDTSSNIVTFPLAPNLQ